MKTYFKISLVPLAKEYPFKVPADVKRKAKDLCNKLSKYLIVEDLNMLYLPMESAEYSEVMAFVNEHCEYFYGTLGFYERKYSKHEMENAEYFTLKIANLVYSSNESNNFEYCCNEKCFAVGTNNNMRLEARSMKNKDLGFTSDYRFVISENLKTIIENSNISNMIFIPAFHEKKDIIVAYQIEPIELMANIAELNDWIIYRSCANSGKTIYDSNYVNQLAINKAIAMKMHDFNATSELFTELGTHEYIISKKLYLILKACGIKSLKCEPIRIVE